MNLKINYSENTKYQIKQKQQEQVAELSDYLKLFKAFGVTDKKGYLEHLHMESVMEENMQSPEFKKALAFMLGVKLPE